MSATRVITLPPGVTGAAALEFAQAGRRAGAQAIEVRTDLHAAGEIDAARLAAILPLLVAERGVALPGKWVAAARWVDLPTGSASPRAGGGQILSHHAPKPLTTEDARTLWRNANLPAGAAIKHVEPLGDLATADRLLETQRGLQATFPDHPVTVLATGALALPFRCLLAERNALDYLRVGEWVAAEGQRRLEDAVRSNATGTRRGILGSGIAHSRSPRIHRQPFDRIELPPETSAAHLRPLLKALLPHYDGFAVTSPFKKAVAAIIEAPELAVNTLVRRRTPSESAWLGFNTDVQGARAALQRLGTGTVQVLGDGGATTAVRLTGAAIRVFKRATLSATPLSGLALWTWPAHVEAPSELAFRNCRVGFITYGAPARTIAAAIRARGGTPVALGPTWLVAQAREQQRLWEAA